MSGTDISIGPAPDGHRVAAHGLARKARGLNPIGARFRLCAPRQRQQTKDQRKSHRILHLSLPHCGVGAIQLRVYQRL
jgi:hypothetical protein